jgi:hypothetical protein
MQRDVFLPEDRQGDVLALHLAMHAGPIGFRVTPMARFDAGVGEKPLLRHSVGQPGVQRPGDARRSVNRTVDDATPIRRAVSRVDIPAVFNLKQSRTWRIAILSIGIGTLLGKAERADPKEAGRGASPRAISARNGGRNYPAMAGDFISES